MKKLILIVAVGLFTTMPSLADCSLTDHYCNDEYEDQYDRQQEHIDAHNQMMRDAAEQHDEYLRDQEDDRRHNQIISLLEALK